MGRILKLVKDLLVKIYDIMLFEVADRIIDFFWNLFSPPPKEA